MSDPLLAALIGGLAGIIAGWGGAYLTARQQRQAAVDARWMHRRQDAYLALLEAAEEIEDASIIWWPEADVAEESAASIRPRNGSAIA
jgi:hypothetical protein